MNNLRQVFTYCRGQSNADTHANIRECSHTSAAPLDRQMHDLSTQPVTQNLFKITRLNVPPENVGDICFDIRI